MTTTLAAWSARLPAVNADGTFTTEFIRWLQRQLVVRVGGGDAMSNLELAEEIGALGQLPASSPQAEEALRGVDELRNELASLRSDCDALRAALDMRDAELAGLRTVLDLRGRVEQLENAQP